MEEHNAIYNLMTQYTQIARGLWRIEKHYLNDAKSDEEKTMWNKTAEEYRKHLDEIRELLKKAL